VFEKRLVLVLQQNSELSKPEIPNIAAENLKQSVDNGPEVIEGSSSG
jgi:hypothetical protein